MIEMETTPSLRQKIAAEFLGTFLFVFVGAGSAVSLGYIASTSTGANLLVGAFANGLGLAIAVTATMSISGGHLNPAVTLGFLAARKIPIPHAVAYIISQVIGASIAGLLLISVLPTGIGNSVGWGAPAVAGISVGQAIALEGIMTFILVLTVFGTAVDPRAPKVGGFAIGLIVAADVLIGGPFTGAAMNPARAIGPQIAGSILTGTGAFANWYVWWIGPILGGVVAALVYVHLIWKK